VLRIGYILVAAACLAASVPADCAQTADAKRECGPSCACCVEKVTCCCAPRDPKPEPVAPPAGPQDTRKVPAAAPTAAPVEGPEAAACCDGFTFGGTDRLTPLFSQPIYLRIEHFLN